MDGGGDAGERLRGLDWSSTALGAPVGWPTALKTLVGIMLGVEEPTLILWGDTLTALYNDPHAALIGDRHPETLGRPIFEVWGDRNWQLQPLFQRVLSGRPGRVENFAARIERYGISESANFNIACTPIFDHGVVAGILCRATDITAKIRSERYSAELLALSDRLRHIDNPRDIIDASIGALGRYLGAQRVGFGEVQADDRTILLETSYADGVAPLQGLFELDRFGADNVMQQRSGRLVVHDDITRAPGEDQALWAALQTRSLACVPLIRGGRFRAAIYINFRDVHTWSQAELSLAEEVAARIWDALDRARAETALRESQARLALSEESLRLAIDAAEFGTWDLDLVTNVLTGSAHTKTMFGISPDAPYSLEDFYNGIHPDDREETLKAFKDAIDPAQRRPSDVEYRTIGKDDGRIRWVAAKGRALFDDEGRCIRAMGTLIDITARKEMDAHIRAQDEALKNARENLTTIFNASSEGLTLCKAIRNTSGDLVDYQVLDVNPAHENLTGATRSQMLSKVVSQIAPPVKPIWFESADRALKTGALQTFEIRSPVTGRWLDIHVSPVSGDYFAQTFIDVTERHELEQQRVEFIAEMNHRVKNNFQMVASVLNLQARRSQNLEVKDQLKTAQHRIHVLAELHDSLSAAPQVGQVDFSAYLKALCEKLRSSINDADRIELRFSAEPATFDSGVAVPLGFVINELVTNAIKYAFPAPASGVINVVFAAHGDGYVLKVSDNGQGLSQAKPANSGGLGMRLVKSFVKQIGGEVEVAQKSGLLYSIKIPSHSDGLSVVSTR